MKKNKKNNCKIIFTGICVFMNILIITAQNDNVYKSMSLDELLSVDVVITASKQPEDLFETPLSTTIVSKEEIERSGVTSIPEALRLAQGVIVREITPGNYDIHTRGYDDLTKNVYLSLPFNTTTLVMIDSRIVYNYFSGGTLWETLPIDLNDVERIEVVRGPASALYGANAVTGVINIITSHAQQKGMNVTANGIVGTNNAKNANVNIGYNWNDKTKLSFSGNFSKRNRFNTDYFNYKKNSYTDFDDLNLIVTIVKNKDPKELWTFEKYKNELNIQNDEDVSLNRLGGNLFFNHRFSELTEIGITVGAQKSQSQNAGLLNIATALSQVESKSYYLDTKITHQNFAGQFNINSGQHISNNNYGSYKFTDIAGSIEYFKQFGQLSFRPGIAYKNLTYNSPLTYEEPINFNTFDAHFKDEERVSSSYSAYMLSEWKPTQKLRFIGAARVDKFDINKNYLINLELASTYRMNKNNMLRFAVSKANKSPFFFESYLNVDVLMNYNYINEATNTNIDIPIDLKMNGQKDLKYTQVTNFEIGWRKRINQKLTFDVETFYSFIDGFVNSNVYRKSQIVQRLNNLGQVDGYVSIKESGVVQFENYDLVAHQYGAGFTLTYKPTDNIDAKLYATFQNTKIAGKYNIESEITNITVGDVTPENTVAMEIDSKMNPTQWGEKKTPLLFGGFNVNYKYNNKWNFETDAYFYSKQNFVNYDSYKLLSTEDVKSNVNNRMEIKANLILNAKASYKLTPKATSFVTFKNILGKHYEYGFTDQIGRQLLIGLKWELQ